MTVQNNQLISKIKQTNKLNEHHAQQAMFRLHLRPIVNDTFIPNKLLIDTENKKFCILEPHWSSTKLGIAAVGLKTHENVDS